MLQVCRQLTTPGDGALAEARVLLCDRDSKWSRAVRELLTSAGVQVIQTPFRAPNANAHAERFVRSVRTECLNRVIPLGERHFRETLQTFVEHYHHERNHQGLGNRVLEYRAAKSPGPRDSSAGAAGWTPQLLLPGRVMTMNISPVMSAEFSDTTSWAGN